MRYVVFEATWSAMTLAEELKALGLPVTRVDGPEDLGPVCAFVDADVALVPADLLGAQAIDSRALRGFCPGLGLVALTDTAAPHADAAAIEAGADMVVDPAMPAAEIAARLLAIARRRHGLAVPAITLGSLRIDLAARSLGIGGAALHVTPKVYALLEYAALRPNRVVTREALLGHVYGLEGEPDPRVFDVYLCTLRRALRTAGAPLRIETVRGTGLRLVPPPDAGARPARAAA